MSIAGCTGELDLTGTPPKRRRIRHPNFPRWQDYSESKMFEENCRSQIRPLKKHVSMIAHGLKRGRAVWIQKRFCLKDSTQLFPGRVWPNWETPMTEYIQKNMKIRRKMFNIGQIEITKASHRILNDLNCRISRSKRNKRSKRSIWPADSKDDPV
jgi:hypothetical protein